MVPSPKTVPRFLTPRGLVSLSRNWSLPKSFRGIPARH
ncbi:unnamed protein product [Toxocara canis]|uniref:Uncharacterized protein n=1 Tax=Toxocara canis TaxID=6265 RepID=A0A183UER0_TOXCA|nr:unnamed protein product [Toxocara canis]